MDKSNPLDVMARTVYGEARGEGRDGWIAVAWVIKNRADKPGWWGDDIPSVCLHPFQFDCWLPSDPNSKTIQAVSTQDATFAAITAVCDDVINGRIPDPTGGATYYYATWMDNPPHSPPKWAVGIEPSYEVGHQKYFNEVA